MLQGLWGDMKMSGWVEVGFWRPHPVCFSWKVEQEEENQEK